MLYPVCTAVAKTMGLKNKLWNYHTGHFNLHKLGYNPYNYGYSTQVALHPQRMMLTPLPNTWKTVDKIMYHIILRVFNLSIVAEASL